MVISRVPPEKTMMSPVLNRVLESGLKESLPPGYIPVALSSGIYPGGKLSFKPDSNTRFKTGDIMVFSGGTLEIGTSSTPIANNVTAEVIIRDIPLDSNPGGIDPKRLLRTITSLNGIVRMYGRTISPSFIRSTQELLTTGTAPLDIRLESSALAAGWAVGDKIAVPNSQQCNSSSPVQVPSGKTEERTISAISPDGLTITIPGLTCPHPGARDADNVLVFTPHIVHLTRNIIIRSENPNGTRGHMLFDDRADVDIRYISVLSMGRTNTENLDITSAPAGNQKGRYPIHFHHLVGPTSPQSNGRQFTLMGTVVDFGAENTSQRRKWGITGQGRHLGLGERNIGYRAAGAAFAAEDANETGNKWYRNFALAVAWGNGERGEDRDPSDNSKLGREGVGFWINGIGYQSEYDSNVGADSISCVFCYGGFKFDNVYNGPNITVPAYQGADPYMSGQGTAIDPYTIGINYFKHNEVYSSDFGLTFWWICSELYYPRAGCTSSMQDVKIWNTDSWGIYAYESSNLTIDGYTNIGDKTKSQNNQFSLASAFALSDYAQNNVILRNLKVHNLHSVSEGFSNYGQPDDGLVGTMTIENSDFSNFSYEWKVCTVGSTNGSNIRKSNTVFRNVRFRKPAGADPTWLGFNVFKNNCDPAGGAIFDNNKPIWATVENYTSAPAVSARRFTAYPIFQYPTAPPTG